jgi:signal transduction histidine kinase
MTLSDGAAPSPGIGELVAWTERLLGQAVDVCLGRAAVPEEAVRHLRCALDELGVVTQRLRKLEGDAEWAGGLGSAGHELRGMLNTVAGWAQLVRLEDAPPAKVLRASQTIERNVRALLRLVETMDPSKSDPA